MNFSQSITLGAFQNFQYVLLLILHHLTHNNQIFVKLFFENVPLKKQK